MSLLSETKVLFRAVGIALSSAAARLVVGRVCGRVRTIDELSKTHGNDSPISVYTGYNTLSMAMTLPPDGKVVACDITDKYMKEVDSQSYFKEAGVESKIDLKLQSAITTLDELLAGGEADSFGLVFVDADKLLQDQFYERSLLLLEALPGFVWWQGLRTQ